MSNTTPNLLDNGAQERFERRAAEIERLRAGEADLHGRTVLIQRIREAQKNGETVLGIASTWDRALTVAKDLDIDTIAMVPFLGDLWSGKRTLTKDHVLVFVSEDCLREIGMIAAISRAAQAAGATFVYV